MDFNDKQIEQLLEHEKKMKSLNVEYALKVDTEKSKIIKQLADEMETRKENSEKLLNAIWTINFCLIAYVIYRKKLKTTLPN